MSPNVVQYASEHDYGDLVTTWQPESTEILNKKLRNSAITTVIGTALAATSVALLPWHDSGPIIIGFACAFFAIVFLFFAGGLPGIISTIFARKRQERRTHLYTNGIVFSDADQVLEAFDFRSTAITVHRMVIKRNGSISGHEYFTTFFEGYREHRVSKPDIPYADEVSIQVPEVAARAKTPVVLTQLAAGETLDFGEMKLAPTGFSRSDASQTIPYSAYKTHRVEQGELKIIFGNPAAELTVEYREMRDAAAVVMVIRVLASQPKLLETLNGTPQ